MASLTTLSLLTFKSLFMYFCVSPN